MPYKNPEDKAAQMRNYRKQQKIKADQLTIDFEKFKHHIFHYFEDTNFATEQNL